MPDLKNGAIPEIIAIAQILKNQSMVVEEIEKLIKKKNKFILAFSIIFIIFGLLLIVGFLTRKFNPEKTDLWVLFGMSVFFLIVGSLLAHEALKKSPFPELIINNRSAVVWMYMAVQQQYGRPTGHQFLMIGIVNGKRYSVPGKKDITDAIFRDLIKLMPEVNLGYTVEKERLYKKNPAEFAQAVKMIEQ